VPTCGEAITKLLRAYGVDTVFGIPGIHTVELYRSFGESKLRHIAPRHEQGAGFMAYGYVAATGRPAACFLITGPGVLNAATAIAEAYSDSIPMLIFCTTIRSGELGMGGGRLHEIPSQQKMLDQITGFTHTLLDPSNLPELFARAFTLFGSQRPRPVCIEIPIDILERVADFDCTPWPLPRHPAPSQAAVQRMASSLARSRLPLIILGGGAMDASKEATLLAERINAPVLLTQAGKGIVSESHPLCLGFLLPLKPAQDLIANADLVLAIGTELAEADRYMIGGYNFRGELLRIDIDPLQLSRNFRPTEVLLSDARAAILGILAELDNATGPVVEISGAKRVAALRTELEQHRLPGAGTYHPILDILQDALPADTFISADSTQLAYEAAMYYRSTSPRSWCFPCGFGTLGTGLPAAIGAKLGAPDRPVACIAGDGGFLYSIEELAVAVEAKLGFPIFVWNNYGYGEIRDSMISRGVRPVGVDFRVTDFISIARGFGCHAAQPESVEHLRSLIAGSFASDCPTVIELREDAAFLREMGGVH
jgi:thiamine pyrophosphate-dependent acetolactate synthase large subunit-like protein